jgi:transcriptional regulator with XRE-family HTH domain
MNAGRAVKVIREAQDLGLNELATLAGVSGGYLSQVEQGKKTPSTRWLRHVTDALGANLANLAAAS